jgi:protein-disulfide isomerase
VSIHPIVRLVVPVGLFSLLVAAPRRHAATDPGDGPAPVLPAVNPTPAPDVDLTELYHEIAAPGAKVTVVEFSDFGCPYCGRFERQTFPELRKEFVETGKVRWRFVPFVLGMFPNGGEAMKAASCVADQGDAAFWKMHDLLFQNQDAWKGARNPDALLRSYAVAAGADGDAWKTCYQGARADDRMAAADALAERSGVRSTPSFFINGKLVQGALPLEDFRRLLSDATG